MTSAPAGWYPNPDRPDERLWWTGAVWMQGPPPMPPLLPWLGRGRGVLLPVGAVVASVGLLLIVATIFFVGAPSRPCVPAEPCGPDQIASPLGAVIAFAGMCLLGPALWSRRLPMRLRLGSAGAAAALTAAGLVVFVGSF